MNEQCWAGLQLPVACPDHADATHRCKCHPGHRFDHLCSCGVGWSDATTIVTPPGADALPTIGSTNNDLADPSTWTREFAVGFASCLGKSIPLDALRAELVAGDLLPGREDQCAYAEASESIPTPGEQIKFEMLHRTVDRLAAELDSLTAAFHTSRRDRDAAQREVELSHMALYHLREMVRANTGIIDETLITELCTARGIGE